MAAFGSETASDTQDSSPTSSYSSIYIVLHGDHTVGDTIKLPHRIVISAPSAASDPPPILTKDEERALKRWENQVSFWAFVDWLCRYWPKPRLPETKVTERHDFGTSNHLRPTPMLC